MSLESVETQKRFSTAIFTFVSSVDSSFDILHLASHDDLDFLHV